MRHDPVSLGSPRFDTVEHGPFLITSAFFPARLVLPPHTHERTVVAATVSGRWTSAMCGRTLESTRGYVLTEPAGERHGNHFAAGGARILIVQPDSAASELFRPCTSLLHTIHHRPSESVSTAAIRLERELRRNDDLSSLAIQGLCLELLALAGRDVMPASAAREPWLTRVEDYLRAHFRERIGLNALAVVGGVHPSHLARAFRLRHRTSPAQFVRTLRIEWATARLRDSRSSISEIALSAGFADQSHFTRVFRRATGLTPARFRDDA